MVRKIVLLLSLNFSFFVFDSLIFDYSYFTIFLFHFSLIFIL